jgi:putative DNA-invertase from lambdoid prophage Rac
MDRRLDRWGRSVADLLATLQELEHLCVGFVSLTEALDLTTPAGRAMATVWQCSPSSSGRFCEKGFAPAWSTHGRTANALGWPLTAALQTSQVRRLHRAGVSKAEIARRLQIGRTSVRRILD